MRTDHLDPLPKLTRRQRRERQTAGPELYEVLQQINLGLGSVIQAKDPALAAAMWRALGHAEWRFTDEDREEGWDRSPC